jgi:hypothetical protein
VTLSGRSLAQRHKIIREIRGEIIRETTDALVNYAVEPADPERSVPNPECKALAKTLRESRAALKELEQAYGQKARGNPEAQRPTMRGFKIAQAELSQQISALQTQCRKLQVRLAGLPKRVPLKALLDEADIVKLAPEAKHLTTPSRWLPTAPKPHWSDA